MLQDKNRLNYQEVTVDMVSGTTLSLTNDLQIVLSEGSWLTHSENYNHVIMTEDTYKSKISGSHYILDIEGVIL